MLDPLYKHFQNLSNLPIIYLVAEEARCSNKVRYSKDFGFNSLRLVCLLDGNTISIFFTKFAEIQNIGLSRVSEGPLIGQVKWAEDHDI